MTYAEERAIIINDANRHNPVITVEDTRSSMLAYFAAKKEEEERAKASAKKVVVRNEGRGYNSKDGQYYIYTTTRKDILGRPVEY